ncbi:NRAMP family, partial [Syncephalis fuscata]
DPGSLESDLQAGAITGYRLLWLLLWSHVIGLIYQVFSARLGVVTGRHLAEHLRADAQLVIGTAIAIQVLFGTPLWLGVLLTGLNIPLLSLMSYLNRSGNGQTGKRMEWCFAGAIGLMASCFFCVMGLSKPKVGDIFYGLVIPTVPKKARMQAVGLFGATVMPHNVILHSALVKAAAKNIPSTTSMDYESISKNINFYLSLEACVTLFVSFLINSAILISFACIFPLHQKGDNDVKLPGLYEGAHVLEKAFGPLGPLLWGFGLLAAGQTATITVTLAGQHVLQGFWRQSMSAWQRIASTRILSLIPAFIAAIWFSEQMDMLGEWFNVLQSVCLPIALVPLLRLTNSKSIM